MLEDKKKLWTLALVAAVLIAGVWLVWPSKAKAEGILPLNKIAEASAGAVNWSGLYLGAGGGYQVGDTGVDLNCGDCGAVDPYTLLRADVSGRGWALDARAGFDWQVPSTVFVIGALGGYNWGHIGDNGHDPDFDTTVSGTIEQTWYAGGRVGVAWPSKTLTYVGYAWTQAEANVSRGSGGDVIASSSKTVDGQMLLVGLEQVIAPQITLGAEYTLSMFDETCFDLDGHSVRADPNVHAFKARLNWRPFGK